MDPVVRRERVAAAFVTHYGSQPTIWVRAPGRVDLMGSHTDYNLGYVLTLPIDRDTWIAARPRSDGQVRIHSLNLPGGGSFGLDAINHDPSTPWTDYVRGVAAVLQVEGYTLAGFDALVHSTIPLGSGLSSSAARLLAFSQRSTPCPPRPGQAFCHWSDRRRYQGPKSSSNTENFY